MPRQARPWFRQQTGWWMVQIDGRQVKLAEGKRNKRLAEKKFHELMLLRAEAPESADAQVASLCEAFLDWSHRHQASDTYRNYRFYIQSFCEARGRLLVRELKPYHVTRWVDAHSWNETSRYNAMRSVFRVFNWAVDEGLIEKNPFKGMKRPRPRSRDRYLTEDEYKALLTASRGSFKALLFALRHTGARPCEVRNLTWDQVQSDRWVLKKHKTSHKVEKPRVIHLTPAMQKLMQVLRHRSNSKYVFVNARGKPWTTNAVRLRFKRLKQKLKLADDVCPYLLRHSFGTHAVLNGVDIATVAELMGHVDTTMVSTVYVHLAEQTDHLQAALQKAVAKPRAGVRRSND